LRLASRPKWRILTKPEGRTWSRKHHRSAKSHDRQQRSRLTRVWHLHRTPGPRLHRTHPRHRQQIKQSSTPSVAALSGIHCRAIYTYTLFPNPAHSKRSSPSSEEACPSELPCQQHWSLLLLVSHRRFFMAFTGGMLSFNDSAYVVRLTFAFSREAVRRMRDPDTL
jgi:hypothetical protein